MLLEESRHVAALAAARCTHRASKPTCATSNRGLYPSDPAHVFVRQFYHSATGGDARDKLLQLLTVAAVIRLQLWLP